MSVLVAPGVCRYSVLGTYAGRNIANILDVHIDTVGTITDRNNAIADQAAIIVSAWADHILDLVSNNYQAQSVKWVDLNSEDGSVGETSTGTGTDFPANGASAAQALAGNVACRINKQVVAARGQRKGRMYLCGVTDSMSTDALPNNFNAADIASFNTILALFLNAVNQEAGTVPPNYNSNIVVVHTKKGPIVDGKQTYLYDGKSTVTALLVDPTLASQRRRLRG